MKRGAVLAGGIGGVIALVVACSDDPDPAPNYSGSCAILASQCHPYDGKTQIGHDCHELGHAGDDSKCGPRLAECQSGCPEIEGGSLPFHIVDGAVVDEPTNDAAADGPTADSGPDECTAYCACLEDTCKAKYDSIYATGSCVATCKTFTTENRTCWQKFCGRAKNLSEANRAHECDHASGVLADAECDEI